MVIYLMRLLPTLPVKYTSMMLTIIISYNIRYKGTYGGLNRHFDNEAIGHPITYIVRREPVCILEKSVRIEPLVTSHIVGIRTRKKT